MTWETQAIVGVSVLLRFEIVIFIPWFFSERHYSTQLELKGSKRKNNRLAAMRTGLAELGKHRVSRCQRDPAGESLVRVCGADIQKRVSALGSEHLGEVCF